MGRTTRSANGIPDEGKPDDPRWGDGARPLGIPLGLLGNVIHRRAHRMTGRRDTVSASAARATAAAETGLSGHFDPHVPGIRYGVLDELVGYSVRRAQIAIYEDFVKALAPWSFTPQRFSALTIIALNPRLKLTHLADILGIARSGAVTLVDALAEMGYVERHPSPGDRRAYSLAMTERGERDLAKITAAVREHDARVAQRLQAGEARQLMALLSRVTHYAGDAPGVSPHAGMVDDER